MNTRIVTLLFPFFFSCQSNTEKVIADQKAKIDSLESELNNYKVLNSISKEIIDNDSTYTE
jgi:hypothetical protein